jgi:hypothetical protein
MTPISRWSALETSFQAPVHDSWLASEPTQLINSTILTRAVFQIPPDFVVKSQVIDIIGIIFSFIRRKTSSKHCVDQGNRALSCSRYLRVIGLPLNSMESGILERAQETWTMVGLGPRFAIERAEIGNSRPTVVRACALLDRYAGIVKLMKNRSQTPSLEES